MVVTRHISLDDEHVEKIKPYLEMHNGNFGAAIREMIQQAGKRSSRMSSSAVELSLFNWMLEEVRDTLVPDDILDELIDPELMKSMGKLEAYINRKIGELEWDVSLELKYDSDIYPSSVSIGMAGAPEKIKFLACILAQYMVKNSLDRAPLEIKSVVSFSDCIKVELSRSNKKEAQKSLASFFGGMDEVLRAIKSNPAFWKAIIRRHLLSNYNMVTLERNYFEDVLAGKIPSGEMIIENLAKKPLQEIPLKEMLNLIKEVYETSRVVDRVEIDNDTVVLLHNYRNEESIKKLKKSLVALLEANGHLYDAKSAANMVVLTHRPDVGIKINELVDNLKTSDSRVDQELMVFMAFLSGLKDIPDIPISLTALGRRIGRSLMQEYEKENSIKGWDPETFQKALQMVDSRLHRDSEWKLDGKNLLYRVRKCNIATEGDTFDTYVCHIARETFKGALGYAFGNKAELSIKHLLTHGDSFCEVVIRMP
jgi:predicted hydrocarbon binding protein